MASLKKILVTPFFGPFPEWMDKFDPPIGYDWLLDTDLEAFKKRVKRILGIDYPGVYGSGKVWDYRCVLGLLYAEEIKDYDFWGTMDLDCVFGDMNKFYPDEMIEQYDVISGHDSYVAGCFSLYRNSKQVNELFKQCPIWKGYMTEPDAIGWVEQEYSRILENSGLRYKYTFEQGNPWVKGKPNIKKENGRLFQDDKEIALYHFRHFKHWPF
jgi:hypothetical protein